MCTLWNVTSIADRRGALEWIYCLNMVPCVCVLPLFPDLLYWWICMARSVPQQQLVLVQGQRRILKSDQSPAVSVQTHHTLHLFSQAVNVGKKRKCITCLKIRLPTSWWHTEPHCCRYTVTIFQLDDTRCWSGSVYCICEHVAEGWLIVSSGKTRPGQKCSTVKMHQLALMRLQKGPRNCKRKQPISQQGGEKNRKCCWTRRL